MRQELPLVPAIVALLFLAAIPLGRALAQDEGPAPGLGGLLGAGKRPVRPEIDLIASEFDALEARRDAAAIADVIASGRAALAAARAARAEGDEALATRKQQIAWAALSLCSHRLARAVAEQELAAAQRAARAAERSRSTAEAERERARARLAELTKEPAP